MADGSDREDEAGPQAGIDESAGVDGLKDDLEVGGDALDGVAGGVAAVHGSSAVHASPILNW
jgi:hypothetical protein